MIDLDVIEVRHGAIATVRIGPNEDLVEGVCKAVAKAGFQRALVRSGLGSLIDASIDNGLGSTCEVAGPAIEILALSGVICLGPESPAAELTAILGTTRGRVIAGKLVPGRNPVCVTAEIVIEELFSV